MLEHYSGGKVQNGDKRGNPMEQIVPPGGSPRNTFSCTVNKMAYEYLTKQKYQINIL